MILNLNTLNAATTGTWLTGDVNGPSMRWVDAPAVDGTWTKMTEPDISITVTSTTSFGGLLIGVPVSGMTGTTTEHGVWHKETV